LWTVTRSFVKWKAGNRTTGGSLVRPGDAADALAVNGRRRETTMTAIATPIMIARNAPLDLLIFMPSGLVSNVGPRRGLTCHAAGYTRVEASRSLYGSFLAGNLTIH
jgi:hypothetical protein